MGSQVLGQLLDAIGEQGDLYLRRAGIAVMRVELGNHLRLGFGINGHVFTSLPIRLSFPIRYQSGRHSNGGQSSISTRTRSPASMRVRARGTRTSAFALSSEVRMFEPCSPVSRTTQSNSPASDEARRSTTPRM